MRESVFYAFERLFGLTSLRVLNLDTTTPSLPVLFVSNERQHRDTIQHYFALFRLKYATQ